MLHFKHAFLVKNANFYPRFGRFKKRVLPAVAARIRFWNTLHTRLKIRKKQISISTCDDALIKNSRTLIRTTKSTTLNFLNSTLKVRYGRAPADGKNRVAVAGLRVILIFDWSLMCDRESS